jgi:uncharacterized membrane protein YsdA (DUF1294 family)
LNSRSSISSTRRAQGGAGSIAAALVVAGGLLILPFLALHQLGLDMRWVAGYALLINVLTYWAYARDKKRAQEGAWRVSEAQLHLCELLGGWPGAWIAQRRLRHKSSKGSYQFVFWLIVLGYQFAAIDSLQDWKFSRAGLKWIERTSGGRNKF